MKLSHPSLSSRQLLGMLSPLVLAACATPPAHADLRSPLAPEKLETRESLPSARADWPSDNWWQQFGDPQLDGLMAEALQGATDLRVAEARFARAQAAAGMARSSLLPTLNAGAEAGAIQQSDNFLIPSGFVPRGWPEYGQAALSLNWELDFWGRNRRALAAARSDAEAARAEAAAARLAITSAVAASYAQLVGLNAARDAAQNAVKVRQQTLDLIQARKDQGLENNGAVERARASLAMAEGERAAVDEELALARNALAALIGAGPDRGLAIARPAIERSGWTGLPANIPANLLGRRPDLTAARLRAEAAASRIGAARAAFYPNVNLAGVIGMQALGLDKVFTSGSDFGSAGPAITLPIFNGHRLTNQYRATEAEYQMAVAQYDGALLQALREVADATSSQRALGERLGRARTAARSAEAAWTIASNRYRGGLARYLDVLAAEDALIAARRAVALLESRAFALDVALIRALGGGYRS